MLWGDQWICKCGTHNFCLRKKCRDCGEEKEKASVGEESWVEVMDAVIVKNEKEEQKQKSKA